MLTYERRKSLLAYCKLTEFEDDPEVLALLETFFLAAEGYLTNAGISPPSEGTVRKAQYDLCVNYLVCNAWDNRDVTYVATVVADNPVFRRMVTQLKLTEPRSCNDPIEGSCTIKSRTAPRWGCSGIMNVSKSDTFLPDSGEEA